MKYLCPNVPTKTRQNQNVPIKHLKHDALQLMLNMGTNQKSINHSFLSTTPQDFLIKEGLGSVWPL